MTTLTIWCDTESPPGTDGHLALWNSFRPTGAPSSWYSLPEAVHVDRYALRSAYLKWLHDLGRSTHGTSTVVEALRIRPHLSYWWMTLPADFSFAPNSPAYAAVRLMALTSLADRLGVTSVRIVASDSDTRKVLVEWARAAGKTVSDVGPGLSRPNSGSKRAGIRNWTSNWAPPLVALRILLAHIRFARRQKRRKAPRGRILVVDYLAHLAPPSEESGSFGSNYWGPLTATLNEHDRASEPVTFLHLSADRASASGVSRDGIRVAKFNAASPGPAHDLLHKHLTWAALCSSVRDYLRVVRLGLSIRHAGRNLRTNDSTAIWRAFHRARRDQFYGESAMLNCLWINLFQSTLRDMPQQRMGIYLMENQPWEMAFISMWRQYGHGQLVGVIHSTALFWSTRLFRDPRDCWATDGNCPAPWPDLVAVNGPSMRAACAQGGYPETRLVDVEALRYFHLSMSSSRVETGRLQVILVAGEYEPELTNRLLGLVSRAVELSNRAIDVRFRPHPAGGNAEAAGSRAITLDMHTSLSEALRATDLAVCGAISSAALDASCSGVPTVLVSDPETFFSSPAENQPNTVIIGTAEDLAGVLNGGESWRSLSRGASAPPFHLDPSIPRWRELLTARALAE